MSCGRKLTTIFDYERREIADKLWDSGETQLSRAVERGDCLSSSDERRLRNELEFEHGIYERLDYRMRDCECSLREGEDNE